MSIRSIIKNRPAMGAILGIALILGGGTFIWTRLSDASRRSNPADVMVYYTTDDGHSWFAGNSSVAPPFTHGGKQAVRARIFSYDDGKTCKVLWLEKFTSKGKQLWDNVYGPDADEDPAAKMALISLPNELLVKKPGATKWVSANDPAGAKITERTPDAGGHEPEEQFP